MTFSYRFLVAAVGLVLASGGVGGCKHSLPRAAGGDGGPDAKGGSDSTVMPDGTGMLDGSVTPDGSDHEDVPATPDASDNQDVPATPDVSPDLGGSVDAPPDVVVVPECTTGKHMCPGGCVANNDIHTCGTSCTPCQAPSDGTATCDGTSCGGACPPDKKLCLGNCIDTAAACGQMCPAMQHLCTGLCPSVMDVKACGTSCLPCPVPTGASQASCDGTKCDFQCMTGTHKCGTKCATDADATMCGMACTACPTDVNGTAQCVGGACVIACKTGFHTCGTKCVSNSDVGSCGTTSCTACTAPMGGTVTCDGTGCVPACPSGMKVCNGVCVAMAAACGACPSGTHNCSGICASDMSVDSCGTTSCVACPKPTGANATSCSGTACDFTCGSGYHRCGMRCAADNDATGCGTTCMTCPTDANGTPACVSGVCGLMCKSGFHVCGGKCVDNKAVATCGPNDGSSCSACMVPTGGGTVTCDGLACVPACPSGNKLCNGACIANAMACDGVCPAGTHNCSGICQSDTSATFCGPSCTNCAVPPSNGMAMCTNAQCAITCSATFRQCPGTNLCVSNATTGCCTAADCTAGGAHTTPVCGTAKTCSYPCDTANGYTLCNGTCIAAGQCCTPSDCPGTAPSNGAKTCSTAHVCGVACNGGYKGCGGTPAAPASCIPDVYGSCCTNSDCTSPETCGGVVANKCSCPGVATNQVCTIDGVKSCQPMRWGFETDPFIDGFSILDTGAPQSFTAVTHSGSHALSVGGPDMNAAGGASRLLKFVCENPADANSPGDADLRGKTLSAWAYLPSVSGASASGTSCKLRAFDSNGSVFDASAGIPLTGAFSKAPVTFGAYFQLTGTFPTTAAAQSVRRIVVECKLPSGWVCCGEDNIKYWVLDDVWISTQ